jgi:hypothetical protein
VNSMKENLKEKIVESLTSVLPITIIVLMLSFTIAPMPAGTLMLFLFGAAMLIVGMGFFALGADIAMMPMGENMGRRLAGPIKYGFLILVCFLIGFTVTTAEPDLQVLARQVPAVPDAIIIITVALGVGILLAFSALRARFNLPLSKTLVVLYIIVFILSIFVPPEFLAIAFDSGGVTTGPITVPFIMALGIGLTGADKSNDNNFGHVALSSVGPIIGIMILGLTYKSTDISYTPFEVPVVTTTHDVGRYFANGLPVFLKEVLIGLLPIVIFFMIFQMVSFKFRKARLIKIAVGVLYTYIGLVLFLTGANVGFMPAGRFLGETMASLPHKWLLIPIGMLVGYFIVAAEPAVHVLNKQVEELTSGAIPHKAISLSLAISIAISVGLAMIRVLTGISIYYLLIPGYAIALIMSFFSPKIFTAVAFDSGGVASGPMTATFLLPLTMGACSSLGGNVLTDAFGVVAMVPLITIQILGIIYKIKLKRVRDITPDEEAALTDDVIDYTEEVLSDE